MENLLAGKEVKWSDKPGQGIILAGEAAIGAVEDTIRAGEGAISGGQDF